MRLAFTTTFDARNVHNWSGTPYHMAEGLKTNGMQLDYIDSLKRHRPLGFKIRNGIKKIFFKKQESQHFNVSIAKQYSLQVAEKLKFSSANIVLSPLINPIAYLECKQPIVLWTDALYAALLGFYPRFSRHSSDTIHQGNLMTQACLSRCRLAIFSSEWAAKSAIELYGVDHSKVKVIPFGANMSVAPKLQEVKFFIQQRGNDKIKLLFLAKNWERKGGDTVIAVAKALHEAGHAVQLCIVGMQTAISSLPSYIQSTGFISKQTPQGKQALFKLLSESHFLFLPSRADACPMVFAEANAYGLPCLTTHVGGISTAVKDNINGMTFALDTPVSQYCDYLINIMSKPKTYESLALSAYNEYETRLNWQTASSEVRRMMEEII